jgi:hypothetical protein
VKHWFFASVVATLISAATANAAEVSNARTAVRHFGEACLKRLGNAAGVKAWAEQNKLPPVSHPRMRAIMIGEGEGSAWGLPSQTDQRLGLSLKVPSDRCAVWAEAADATELRGLFELVVKGLASPSLDIKKMQDVATPSASGEGRTITYLLSVKGAHAGFQVSLITSTGSLYADAPVQASLQAGPVRVD